MKYIALPVAVAIASHSLPAHAGGVDAGTIISNTAQATYETPGGSQSIASNTVDLSVDELLNLTNASLDAGAVGAAPGSTTLAFEVTNSGNGPEAFRLTANPAVAGNDFDVEVISIAIDTNGNNIFDPGVDEILAGPATTPEIAPDGSITVFVTVTVPATVADGDESKLDLLAEAMTGTGAAGTVIANAGLGGVDAIVGSTGASATAQATLIAGITTVAMTKTQGVADPFGGTGIVPGSVITYTITAAVAGSGSVANFVVTDSYPAGTSYVPGSITLDSAALTDAAGDDAAEAAATGISVNLGTVNGGTSHAISFAVIIE